MGTRSLLRLCLACSAVICLASLSKLALAEGSRNLYPVSYPSTGNVANGARANLDLQPGPNNKYVNRVNRLGFIYVYAEAGEYILLGSSNIGTAGGLGGNVNVYNPQNFGTRGDETIPATADFSCTAGSSQPGTHFFGANLGRIASRAAELAGPNSANGSVTVPNGYNPCGYQAPVTGIYGVLFTPASGGGNPNARVDQVANSSNSVAAWEVAVRASAASTTDTNGRVHTFAFVGYTGGNNRPVFSTLYYVTADGYRYRQDLRGIDPNGYALYANTFGFLDNNQPLYKTLRASNALVSAGLPIGVTTQQAQYPIFFSDISPGAGAEAEAEKVLTALGIALVPPSPEISNVQFVGSIGGTVTSTGLGGTFSFNTTATVSYQIVISRDGLDFDAANPLNRVLTGIAFSGAHQAVWDGLDNSMNPFPASPTPYSYRAYGRNGEVHFPIIDAENNGNSTIPGGGPTITRLNGANPGDQTVFFDDRGYVTISGDTVGVLNGTLCDGPVPAAANPPVSLEGVNSSTSYRRWQNGGNSNSDCSTSAGWGDAKGVNLWTYFLTPEFIEELEVVEFPVDLGTTVGMPATASPGATVQGTFSFANYGVTSVDQVSYSMSLTAGLGTVTFTNLPPGTAAVYNNATGTVALAGFATTLVAGQVYSGMTFSYTAPGNGTVSVDTGITTAGAVPDAVPQNNTATAATAVGNVDVATSITGIPATAAAGAVISGSVIFTNGGPQDAAGVTYSLSIGEPGNSPDDVQFTDLPPGVSASYNAATAEVTLTGMPGLLAAGDLLSIGFSYTAPATDGATIPITSIIATTSGDAIVANNSAAAGTIIFQPAPAPPGEPQGIPLLPLPALLLLLFALAATGASQIARGRSARR